MLAKFANLAEPIESVIAAMLVLRCSLCQIPGHDAPQCWFTGAFYEECRRLNYADIHYKYRGGLRLNKKTEILKARLGAKLEVEKLAIDSKAKQ